MNTERYPIEIEDLKKEYREVKALKGISFKVRKGEVFGFLGPNGAGKSTALNILTGILSPSSGESYLFGHRSKKLTKETKQKIGVVFENNNLYKRLTGRENLKFFSDLYNVQYKKVEELLDFFDLSSAGNRQVKNYSKGMKQRLLIARALLSDPQLLILDEPTSGLDPQSVEMIHRAVEQFTGEGKTVLISTHFMEEADRLCDKIAFINEGEIVTITPPSELKSEFGTKQIEVIIRRDDSKFNILKNIVDIEYIKEETEKIVIELPINKAKLGEVIDKLKEEFDILSIHTREASLHQVFLELIKK
ncbi:MAG: ABC transporter ATP-binding protein [Halanaerobiales bacterium]